MLELFLIAQCSLMLPDGSTQNFEFCGNTAPSMPTSEPSQDLLSPNSPHSEQSSLESNAPISYQYLTNNNYEQWKVLVKNFDPINGNSQATLDYANSLFGSGQVIQTKGPEAQKIQWKEFDRSVEAWFKKEGSLWVVVDWKSQGF